MATDTRPVTFLCSWAVQEKHTNCNGKVFDYVLCEDTECARWIEAEADGEWDDGEEVPRHHHYEEIGACACECHVRWIDLPGGCIG